MLMTFDFIIMAMRDENLMKEIQSALSCNSDYQICTDIHRLHFNGKKQTVFVEALSETSAFRHKIVPKEIPYSALQKMLTGDGDSVEPDVLRFEE